MNVDEAKSYGLIVTAEPDAAQVLSGILAFSDGLDPAEGLTGCAG
jgi:hypothetical protein